VDRNSSAGAGAKNEGPQEEEAPALQQQRPRSTSGRRLSSDSSTGSFTAISMEDEGLMGARQEEAALQSHTPPQQPHPLRSAASASQSSAPFADQGRSSSSSAQAAWAKASSFSNPAYVADFTAIPPLTDSTAHHTHLPLPPSFQPAAGKPEHSGKADRRHIPSADAHAANTDEQQAPSGYTATRMEATMGSLLDHSEELPVDRCIVSGDSFYSGNLMSGSSGGLQRGARVTQRASDGAVVLELPGARQLLLVHDEQEGGGLAGTRLLPAREAGPSGAHDGHGGKGAIAARHSTLARKGRQAAEGPHPIIQVMRAEMGDFGARTAKSVLLVGLGAGYVSSFARLMMDIERGTSPRPGSLMGHCIMDSSTVVASMLSGVVAGPIVASAYLARLALRPALLAGAVHVGVRWVRRHRNGAAALLKMLSSGDLLRRIEALKGIAKRAANSPAFRREFGLLSGVELVLAVLADALAGAQAAINAATQEQAADDATSDATGPVPLGCGRARVKQPRGVRARGAAAAAKTSSTAAAAAAAVRSGRVGEGNMHGACIVGADGNLVPVLGLSGPLPMLATQALRELLRSPEHTMAPLVRAGGVTLLVHAAATSMYTVPPSAAAAGVTLDAGEAAAGAGMLHTSSNAPLAVAALQVLEAVASAPLSEVNTPLPTTAADAATALTKGDKEEAAAKEGFAHAVSTARMQLASDPMSVRLLVHVVHGHMAMAARECHLMQRTVEGTDAQQLQADKEEGGMGASTQQQQQQQQQAALSKHFAAAWPAVRLLHAVALEPVGKAMLGEAQGVHALVEVLCAAPTGSKIMSAAAAALHTAVRGSVANSTLLSSLDLQPPALQTQSNTPITLPVGGLLAAAAAAAAAPAGGDGCGVGAAGHESKSTLRAHMHHALAHVNRAMSHSGAAGAEHSLKGVRRASSGSTASNGSGSNGSANSLCWSIGSSLDSAVPAAWMDVTAGASDDENATVNNPAGLSADLCALLCVMDRYHQHAVDAAAHH